MDRITPLIDAAIETLLRGSIARTVTAETARFAFEHLAHQVEQQVRGEVLLSLETSQTVADRLGISRRRVLALARSRSLGWNAGRDWIFTPQDIDAMRDRKPGRPRTMIR